MFAEIRANSRATQVGGFIVHFFQMAVAMMVGMALLGIVLAVTGQQGFRRRAPEGYELTMGVAMVIPMVAWMRLRGHSWERALEMSGAMVLPVVPFAVVCALNLLPHQVVFAAGGIFMWTGMLAAMLYRRDEYATHQPHRIAGR